MLRRNVAGQHLYFMLLDAAGAAIIGATVTARRGIDGAAQAACTGTVTDMGNGQYRMNLSQADTDGNSIGYLFTATGAIPVHIGCLLTAADPTNATSYGITRLDATVTSRMASFTLPTGFLAATFPATVASPTNITAGTISTVTNLTNLPSIPANWITAAGVAASALNGKGDWNVGKTGYTLTAGTGLGNQTANITGSVSSVTGAVGSVTGNVGGNVAGSVGSVTGLNASLLDAAVSTRSTYAGADTAGTTTLLARLTAPRATALDNLDATISSRSTYAGADTSGTTTLLSRLTGPRATLLDNLDAAVSSRSTYNGADTAGVTTLLGRLTGPRATALDLLDVAVSTRMASGAVALDAAGREAIADAILARNIAGGANGGRTVGEAHAFVRSRWNIVGTTLTVYANDDTTPLWTGEIVPGPGGVITGMDPT